MFTGIIREAGRVASLDRSAEPARLRIAAPETRRSLVEGGSVAVDGVCLTVTDLEGDTFAADVIPETLSRTRLGQLAEGDRVNLELPLQMGQLLDGHIVQGHVDGVGVVASVRSVEGQTEVAVRVGPELAPFLAEKGSVAVNGVSLTVVGVTEDAFSVALIPTTLKLTNLGELEPNVRVNLEVDVLARYVARWEEMTS